MPREPLLELPLERFIPTPFNHDHAPSNSSKRSAQKRPLSPGLAGTLISPAKRRMMGQAGVVTPFRIRSPLSDFAAQPDPSQSRVPAGDCKLEPAFSREENVASGRENDSGVATTPRAVRTSPRLAARVSISSSTPSASSRRAPRSSNNTLKARSPSRSREESPLPSVIARPRPSSPDRGSEHYPGFDIYYDTQVLVERARSPEAASKPSSRHETDKENLRPKRGRRNTGASEKDKHGVENPRRSPRLSDARQNGDVAWTDI